MHDHDIRPLTAASAALLRALDSEKTTPEDLYSAAGSAVYEHFTAEDRSEIAPLTAAVRRTVGPILELACGGGRITIPLLSLGRAVVGVDLSSTMVEILRTRVADLPPTRIHPGTRFVVGDMTDFALPERFGAIVLAATSVALLDAAGRRALLDGARRHLSDDGRFFITASSPGHLYRPGSQSSRVRAVPGPDGRTGAAVVTTAVTPDGRYRDVDVVHLGLDEHGRTAARVYHSRVNVVDADEVQADAEARGFRVLARSELPDADDSTLLELVAR
ncbi:class I SAM-dependent methyltransferase [Microbacteriaceae bacterium VKM Ac-2855]|nr:class I SAM-dependent methyltransferase [Microbacteriaceae bacterium VKM Ac-2855]